MIERRFELKLHRSCHVNDCIVERGKQKREYRRISEHSVNRIAKFLRRNRDIQPEIDFMFYTEVIFYADKEEPESDELPEFPVYYDAQGNEHAEY